jgi:hypothetical protein
MAKKTTKSDSGRNGKHKTDERKGMSFLAPFVIGFMVLLVAVGMPLVKKSGNPDDVKMVVEILRENEQPNPRNLETLRKMGEFRAKLLQNTTRYKAVTEIHGIPDDLKPGQRMVEYIIEKGVPVVWKSSAVQNWTALHKWSFRYLDAAFKSQLNGRIMETIGNLEVKDLWAVFEEKRFVKYDQFTEPYRSNTNIQKIRFSDLAVNFSNDYVLYGAVKTNMDGLGKANLYEDILGWQTLMITPEVDIHDSDVWITTSGVNSHAHYDLQHNFYASVYGEKRFTLLPPSELRNVHLYPFHHPMQRQIQPKTFMEHLNLQDAGRFKRIKSAELSRIQMTVLRPGDVLYIPPCMS